VTDCGELLQKKMSFQHNTYYFHCVKDDSYAFVLVATTEAPTRIAFAWLNELVRAWYSGGMNDKDHYHEVVQKTLQADLDSYDRIMKIQASIDEAKAQMNLNIHALLDRSEQIDRLIDTTEMLDMAASFKAKAATLRTKTTWGLGLGSLVSNISEAVASIDTSSMTTQADAPAPAQERPARPADQQAPSESPAPATTVEEAAPPTEAPKEAPIEQPQEKAPEDPSNQDFSLQPEVPQEEQPIMEYSQLPKRIESAFEDSTLNMSVRPTIINPGNTWERTSFPNFTKEGKTETLDVDQLKKEKNKAFDLLDALSRSGTLSFDFASLHIVVAMTHCFDKTLLETIIQKNENPIELIEQSTLIVANQIFDKEDSELIAQPHFLAHLRN